MAGAMGNEKWQRMTDNALLGSQTAPPVRTMDNLGLSAPPPSLQDCAQYPSNPRYHAALPHISSPASGLIPPYSL